MTPDPDAELAGKSPWEFVCQWYTVNEIEHSIARSSDPRFAPLTKIPSDIYSREFAEWLTDQYRLAMRKGIELGQRSAARLDNSVPVEVVEGLAEVLEAYLSKSTYDPELKSFGFPLDCDTYDKLLNMKIALTAAAPYRKNNPQE